MFGHIVYKVQIVDQIRVILPWRSLLDTILKQLIVLILRLLQLEVDAALACFLDQIFVTNHV